MLCWYYELCSADSADTLRSFLKRSRMYLVIKKTDWSPIPLYRMSQTERSAFWEAILTAIPSKNAYVHVTYSVRFPR
jgi:hypothetical protein